MSRGLTRRDEEALLGRPVEPLLTMDDRASFAGRRCLVTGAGGTVGSELARQLAACEPSGLTLIDHSEHGLFRIEQELSEMWPAVSIEPVLLDVTRIGSVRRLLRRVRPHVVFHAAAYKHVTMAERAVCAAAAVNVLGTEAVLDAACDLGARFVLVSSDKAASPTSVMGATKRVAELLTTARAAYAAGVASVRFGNVLASSGSFVELMFDRVREGRSLIITDPDATRYFMTVTEAASLVMLAATSARGGETFWLDMGEPVRIGDLADRLLAVAASYGAPRVPVETIGLRPGEKRTEQLTTHGLAMRRTDHPRIWVAREAPPVPGSCAAGLRLLRRHVAHDDALGVLSMLERTVGDFKASAQAWAIARAERLYRTPRGQRAARTA